MKRTIVKIDNKEYTRKEVLQSINAGSSDRIIWLKNEFGSDGYAHLSSEQLESIYNSTLRENKINLILDK